MVPTNKREPISMHANDKTQLDSTPAAVPRKLTPDGSKKRSSPKTRVNMLTLKM